MTEPWRRRCPAGHCSVSPRQDGCYYCEQCDRRYDHLVDAKTGRRVTAAGGIQ